MRDELIEKYVRDTLEHLKTHARQSNVNQYKVKSDFSDGIIHAVHVIESTLDSVHDEELFDPTDPAKEIE